jgi:hypothetical protein
MATPSKELPKSEVIALRARIVRELRIAEFDDLLACGDDDDQYPLVRNWKTLTPKVRLLVSMLMRTRAASSRVGRARIRAEREARSQQVGQVFDDALHDKAHQQLRAAALALHNAEKAFDEHAGNVEQLRLPIEEPFERGWAQIAARLRMGVERLMEESRVFDGCRDIASAGEWDELLTDFAMELSGRGSTDTEIAALLLNVDDGDAARSVNQRRRRRAKAVTLRSGLPDP